MNITATVLLAFGMSMDDLQHQSVKVPPSINRNFLKHANRPYFWCRRNPDAADRLGKGMLASRFVLEWNHWIAFVLRYSSAGE